MGAHDQVYLDARLRGAVEGFDHLDAPVLRVCNEDVPLPYAANLEKLALIDGGALDGNHKHYNRDNNGNLVSLTTTTDANGAFSFEVTPGAWVVGLDPVDSGIPDNVDITTEALISSDPVTLTGFGRFELREYTGRRVRHPQTRQPCDTESRRLPAFHPYPVLKRRIREADRGQDRRKLRFHSG